MCIKAMHLAISEHTQERQRLVAVGTAIIRGEDLPALGRIYVFNVIKVVPELDRPETGHRLKLIAKEEVKGAVTALSEVGTQGFLLAAQGQKCMVRGLKEDGSLLPVAFMDMQCYTSVVKELKGTGMCLMGDVVKGCWFAGYFVSLATSSFLVPKIAGRLRQLIIIAGGTLPTPPLRQIRHQDGSPRGRFPPQWQNPLPHRRRRRLSHPYPAIRPQTYVDPPPPPSISVRAPQLHDQTD